jgi:hypothetical protein
MDKRGGGRAFYGFGSLYPSYPLVYKKALSSDNYVPYYLQQDNYKRGGARSWLVKEMKRAGGRSFPIFVDESTEKRMTQ